MNARRFEPIENLYWGLFAAVAGERKPATASDWIAVNDVVTKLWEERAGLQRARSRWNDPGLEVFFAGGDG
jgi:hypothetical protein